MKAETFQAILTAAQGVTRDGDAFVLPDHEATVFVAVGGDILAVARVVRVEVRGELSTFATAKGERFYFDTAAVGGLKIEVAEDRRRGGSAGFR